MSLYEFYLGYSTDPQIALYLMNLARLVAQNLKDRTTLVLPAIFT